MQTGKFKKENAILLSERFIFLIILINSAIIYMQVSGVESKVLDIMDFGCTVIFILEMIVKLKFMGFRRYWRDGWNKMDGTLVILSIPSLIAFFVPIAGAHLSVLLALRLLRALRFFRFVHFFGGIQQMVAGFSRAMKASRSVLAAFLVIIIIFGLINCSLFGQISPHFFGTPLKSIYSVFRLFTIEGWYEIPDSIITEDSAPWVAIASRLYFSLLLTGGGIIGMSFINSIFVDAMVEDNNDDMKKQLTAIQKQLDELNSKLDKLNSKPKKKKKC